MQILHIFEFCSASWLGQIQKCDAIEKKPLTQSQISAVFPIVQFARNQKTALTRESLYIEKMLYFHYMYTLLDVLCYQKILKGI